MTTPAIFESADFKKVPANVRDAANRMLHGGRGMLLTGGVGVGKSYVLWAMVNSARKQTGSAERIIRVVNAVELFDRLRDGIDNPRDEFLEELTKYPGILAVDDLGAEKPSEWVAERLYRIVNARYEARLPIAVTTNLTLEALEERAGYRVVSRLVEACEVVTLEGADRRLA